jgi:hypothetical protein
VQRFTGRHFRSAHLRILDRTLFLYGLNVVQEEHPKPAVMEIPALRISIEWREVFSRRIVADCLLSQPTASINLIQLRSETARKITLKQEGWQRALETVYPFKINKFRIDNGTVTYIDTDPTKLIKLQQSNFVADNIRNIHLPEHRYPSSFHLDSLVFDTGHANLNGHANFLAEPSPSVLTRYQIDRVPLDPLDSPIKRVNLRVKGGVLRSEDVLEYSTDRKRAEAKQIRIDGVHLTYVHTPQTASAESSRFRTIKQTASKANNAPGLLLEVHELQLNKSILSSSNDDSDLRYVLYLSDFNVRLTSLSNHSEDGISGINAHARFMGTGASSLAGTFRPQKHGSDFDLNLAVDQANLPSLNDLLRAYGRFDVQSGNVSIYSQASVRGGAINGYIKMLFNDVVVYNHEKDKNKPLLHQAYELAIGGAAKLLKNRSSQHVATEVKLNGKLNSPTTSTWEALENLVSNAFVNAIEPGFERVIGPVSSSESEVNQHRSVRNAESER